MTKYEKKHRPLIPSNDIRTRIEQIATYSKYKWEFKKNTEETRIAIEKYFRKELGSLGEFVSIKCDLTNNPPMLVNDKSNPKHIDFVWDLHINGGKYLTIYL